MVMFILYYLYSSTNTNLQILATADYLLKVLIEANTGKVEQAIQEAAEELPREQKHNEGCPA